MTQQEAGVHIEPYKTDDATILDSHMGLIENNPMEHQVEN
jgi:hypothetical protein